jgi:phosphate:Na+ symporter
MSWLLLGQAAAGVVLFLFGMRGLSGALRDTAGERMRALLTAATASRPRGFALGLSAGTIAQSTVATVTTVGFVDAGLLSLAAAVPVMIGANVGTTLSMQMISLRLTDLAFVAVAAGGVLRLIDRGRFARIAGEALFGFGLLFLGMKISGDAIAPAREQFAPWLARIDGATPAGMLGGIAVAVLITIVMQSSGAVIGMVFVLAGAGVFSSLWQTLPIVLGARIGTTCNALYASLHCSMDARRAAIANIVFNLLNAIVGGLLAHAVVPWLEQVTPNVVHQTANADTLLVSVTALLALPFTKVFAAGLKRAVPSRGPEPPGSFLDQALLKTPEDALAAALRELGRGADVCVESFHLVSSALNSGDMRALPRVTLNERVVNEIRSSVRAWLARLSRGYLSRRQALFAQGLNRCVMELERIGDHVERLAALVKGEERRDANRLDARSSGEILKLFALAATAIERMAQSFTAGPTGFDAASWAVLDARNAFTRDSVPARTALHDWLARREVPPDRALTFSEFVVTLERIVRHCAVIAQEERQPDFAIKTSKLGRPAGPKEKDDDVVGARHRPASDDACEGV